MSPTTRQSAKLMELQSEVAELKSKLEVSKKETACATEWYMYEAKRRLNLDLLSCCAMVVVVLVMCVAQRLSF